MIEVLSSDEGSKTDIPAWVAKAGHEMVEVVPEDGLRAVRDPEGQVTTMPARVVVLGGGVGGTLAANLLDKELGRDAQVTVVDPTGMHDYQPGLPVRRARRGERALARRATSAPCCAAASTSPIEEAVRIHPDAGTVQLERGGELAVGLPGDRDRRAPGARADARAARGVATSSTRWTGRRAAARRSSVGSRAGGSKVGVAGIPYKCPPAPVEFTFMVDGVPARARASATRARSSCSPR